jgi:hypothetical protein
MPHMIGIPPPNIFRRWGLTPLSRNVRFH